MSKLLKFYENIESDEIVEINFYEPQEQVQDENEEVLTTHYDLLEQEILRKGEQELERAKAAAQKMILDAEEIVKAMHKDMMEEAAVRIQQLEDEAFQRGYEEGFARKTDEIADRLQAIHKEMKASMQYLKQQNEMLVKKQEESLKYLALEVATKVLHKRIEEDPNELKELIKEVMQSVKKRTKVQVELAVDAKVLMEELEEEFKALPIYQNRSIHIECKDHPSGTVLVECDMGLYDASVDTQLENLKKLFLEFE